MPEYELMYLLASGVADDEVSKISEQVKKFIADFGGENIRETLLGKKKLAYPIKKTRNGYYVVVNFSMDSKNVNALDAKIRTQDSTIIRYLILNLDEHLERQAKDKVAQAQLQRRSDAETGTGRRAPATEGQIAAQPAARMEKVEKAPAKKAVEAPILDLDQEELDKKIEAALNEDLTK